MAEVTDRYPKGSAPLITFVSGRNMNRKCGRHKA
jgi:hypothetical protein